MQRCPKCDYERTVADTSVYPGLCPRCGIAYAKWRADPASGTSGKPAPAAPPHFEVYPPLSTRLRALLFDVPIAVSPGAWWARALLFAGLTAWTLYFAWHGLTWEIILGAFLHNANLAFHEFGHLFFMVLGDFMAILGGSLFQLLLPLALMLLFLLRQNDTFAAAATLWWFGQNFIDLAPYIADAEFRGLPLVGGLSEASHDWGNLLTLLGWVDHAYSLGRFSFALGLAIMVAALVWGGYLLYLQRAVLGSRG
jgi:hypothetical protein